MSDIKKLMSLKEMAPDKVPSILQTTIDSVKKIDYDVGCVDDKLSILSQNPSVRKFIELQQDKVRDMDNRRHLLAKNQEFLRLWNPCYVCGFNISERPQMGGLFIKVSMPIRDDMYLVERISLCHDNKTVIRTGWDIFKILKKQPYLSDKMEWIIFRNRLLKAVSDFKTAVGEYHG